MTQTQKDKMYAWNQRWYKGRSSGFHIPVIYRPNPEETNPDYEEKYVTTAYGLAYLHEDSATVRLTDYGSYRNGVPLDKLEVMEDLVVKLAALRKVEGDEAIQHNPECPDCYVEMNWDEGFDCPVCHTHFDSNGNFSHKVCVEYDCSEWAEVLGEDGQPRCVPCEALVLAEEQTPFGPYECKRCKDTVVGIPSRSLAAKSRLCGRDQAADDRRQFLDDILNRRS